VAEQYAFALSPATYPWQDFRPDVLESLRRHYGAAAILEGNKAIKVAGGNGRLPADLVPAVIHKLYTSYGGTLLNAEVYVEGISFWDRAGRHVCPILLQNAECRVNLGAGERER